METTVSEEKNRRHPRWTRDETLILIRAKGVTENGPSRGRKAGFTLSLQNNSSESNSNSKSNSNSSVNGNTEPKWVMISDYCKKRGVDRGPAQCRKRWSNLIGDYKRVKGWEDGLDNGGESFWNMRNDLRKERKLPVSFDWEVFRVLVGRELGGGVGVASPVPLQAVAVVEEEEEVGEGIEVDVEEEVEAKAREGRVGEDEKIVKDGECGSVENVVVLGDEKGEILELGVKSTDQMFEKCLESYDEPNSDGQRESRPGESYWDSQEGAKRRRLSTDDPKPDDTEAEMMQVLEETNKMVNTQLDIHSKNVQLDREQRKETTDVLVAALGKLTDVLVKIAEKL
ncbi:hypothetical protein vseg_017261 [Gypsophila vaccaria]